MLPHIFLDIGEDQIRLEVTDHIEFRVLLAADPRLGGDPLRGFGAVDGAPDHSVSEPESEEDLRDAGDERDETARRRWQRDDAARRVLERRRHRSPHRAVRASTLAPTAARPARPPLSFVRAAPRRRVAHARVDRPRALPPGRSRRYRTPSGDDACCPRPWGTPAARVGGPVSLFRIPRHEGPDVSW